MKKRNVFVAVGSTGILVLLLFLFWKVPDVHAEWVEQTVGASGEYNKYSIWNYMLDFYVDSGSAWLPWNWADKATAGIMGGFHSLTNVIWMVNVLVSFFAGWLIEQAYHLDFITDAIGILSGNIQMIAGVDAGGLRSHGLFPSMLPFLIVAAGVYLVWVGIMKRKASKALSWLLMFVVVLVLGMGSIAYAGNYLNMLNDFQTGLNQECLDIGAAVTTGGDTGDTVSSIRGNLFVILVKTPYLMLQYGTADLESIGEGRVNELLEQSPVSEGREKLVKKEVGELGNENMGLSKVLLRLGMVLLLVVVNLVVCFCIMVLVGIMISAQVLFMLYMSFLPVALVFSLFPGGNGRLVKIVERCFSVMFMRPAVTLLITVVFSISMLCYRLSGTDNFFWMMFLQVLVYVVALSKTRELISYMGIGGNDGIQKNFSMRRAAVDLMMARRVFGRKGKAPAVGTSPEGLGGKTPAVTTPTKGLGGKVPATGTLTTGFRGKAPAEGAGNTNKKDSGEIGKKAKAGEDRQRELQRENRRSIGKTEEEGKREFNQQKGVRDEASNPAQMKKTKSPGQPEKQPPLQRHLRGLSEGDGTGAGSGYQQRRREMAVEGRKDGKSGNVSGRDVKDVGNFPMHNDNFSGRERHLQDSGRPQGSLHIRKEHGMKGERKQ